MAEAGTGKSRLFFEFKAKSQSGWMVLENVCRFAISVPSSTRFPASRVFTLRLDLVGRASRLRPRWATRSPS